MRIFDPTMLRDPRERRLRIEAGRLACPMRGEIDVERCFACRALVTIRGDGDPTYVCCRPSLAFRLPLAS